MRISYEDLIIKLKDILLKHKMSEEDALKTAEVFAKNSLDGIYSHGVNRFPVFVSYIDKELVLVNKRATVDFSFGNLERWNGNLGVGVLNATNAMDRAIKLSKRYGVGIVALRNTNHWMRGGTYGWQAADAGVVGICWTNTIANMPAWGGIDPKIGNNPLVIAVPKSNKEHVVLDMAMSQFAYGRIEEARLKKEQLPVHGGFDINGNLTTDPALIEESGRVLPTGYWKGSGLSILLDLVGSIVSNGKSTTEVSKQGVEYGVNQIFIAIDPSKENSYDNIDSIIDNVINDIKSSSPIKEGSEIFYPGEIEFNTRKENLKLGIPILDEVWKKINSL